MKIYYLLKKQSSGKLKPIHFRISDGTTKINGKHKANVITFSTGLKANPENWYATKEFQGSTTNDELNLQLIKEKKKVEKLYRQLEIQGNEKPELELVRDAYNGKIGVGRTIQDILKTLKSKDPKYEETYTMLSKKINNNIDFGKLFESPQRLVKYHVSFYKEFIDNLKADGLRQTTINNLLYGLKRVYRWVQEEKFINLYNVQDRFKKIKVDKEEVDVIPKEVCDNLFADVNKVKGKLTLHQRMSVDYVLTGLFSALRIGDMLKLQNNNHVVNEGWDFLSVFMEKTREHNMIPIPKFLGDIYRRNKEVYGNILPPASYMKVYYDIPKVFEKVEGAKIPYVKYRTINDVRVPVQKGELWEFISPHWLRRTAASIILLRNGMSESTVKKLGGWTQDSQAFTKYVKIANDFVNEEARRVYEKINLQ
jgi:site-specific recombinase XerD